MCLPDAKEPNPDPTKLAALLPLQGVVSVDGLVKVHVPFSLSEDKNWDLICLNHIHKTIPIYYPIL